MLLLLIISYNKSEVKQYWLALPQVTIMIGNSASVTIMMLKTAKWVKFRF